MKQISILNSIALLAAAIFTLSCAKLQDDSTAFRNADGSITYYLSVSMSESTKALEVDGANLNKHFAEDDRIAIVYTVGSTKKMATSEALTSADIQRSGKYAKFTVTLEGTPDNGTTVEYIYPASMANDDGTVNYSALGSQDGTLASIASNLDLGYYQLNSFSGDFPTNFTLTNPLAICKFTVNSWTGSEITSSLTVMTINDGTNAYTISPSSLNVIYVAMQPVVDNKTVITINATDGTNNYTKLVSGKTLSASKLYPITVTMSAYLNLASVNTDTEIQDSYIVYGTLGGNYKISIADGATVMLDGISISYATKNGNWAGLTCKGDATIVLADGKTNTVVSGFDSDGNNNWPGIYVPQNKTLTIYGNTGILNARCGQDSYGGSAAGIGCGFKTGSDCGNIIVNGGVINAYGGAKSAGIGGVNKRSCGNITINGGTVTAIGDSYGSDTGYGAGIGTGGSIVGTATVTCGDITITGGNVTATGGRGAAGIGTGHSGENVAITCGNITISGGTVIATGGGDADLGYEGAAAIGTGCKYPSSTVDNKCGNITITTGVTRVTATKGSSHADNSIGTSGSNNTCGTITIGGVVTGNISTSPYTYQP